MLSEMVFVWSDDKPKPYNMVEFMVFLGLGLEPVYEEQISSDKVLLWRGRV